LIGIDQDGAAVAAAGERLKDFSNVTIVRNNYCNIVQVLGTLGIDKVDGILLDLGVSSYQLDTPERGFSYMSDAPLDMRMDDRSEMTAAEIVNGYSQSDLARIIRSYGEERFASNIAKHITAAREGGPIKTTGELVEIIKAAIPAKFQKTKGHPAKQTFQAIRIELNNELKVLTETLDTMIDLLAPGGRIAVITFHSLEDRIVKNIFKTAQDPCICPPNIPVCACGRVSKGIVVTKKPVIPSEAEIEENPRAKSSKLRIFEKKA
jgi:16S rRNA (cytosine1402-N4)-methyltransferase